MTNSSPEIGRSITAAGIVTNVHDVGSGHPVLLVHGSGPGVTAWANWRLVLPELGKTCRAIAPDMVGFGYTERPAGAAYGIDLWVEHAIGVLDALGVGQTDVVGNSFGGAIAMALALRHPERVRKLVLMGSMGVSFEITPELDDVWGYQPSVETMRRLLGIFAWNPSLITDDLARMRYEASIRPGYQESFSAMFPAPRQRSVDAMAYGEAEIRTIDKQTLIIHGRDDRVIPLSNSLALNQWIDESQLHVFGQCGHWVQIEHSTEFNRLVSAFLSA